MCEVSFSTNISAFLMILSTYSCLSTSDSFIHICSWHAFHCLVILSRQFLNSNQWYRINISNTYYILADMLVKVICVWPWLVFHGPVSPWMQLFISDHDIYHGWVSSGVQANFYTAISIAHLQTFFDGTCRSASASVQTGHHLLCLLCV